MSAASLAKIEEAVREHVNDTSAADEVEGAFMTDWVIGFAYAHHDGEQACFHTGYATSPMSSPQATVGLFALAADEQAQELAGDDNE